jgi:5-methylcytosine-specific restriction protein A
MPWSTSDRRQRLPSNWSSTIVPRIRRRDGDRCRVLLEDGTRCTGRYGAIDHIIPNDDHRPANLQVICDYHHDRKTAKESAAAKRAVRRRNAAKFRRTETHPGLIGP